MEVKSIPKLRFSEFSGEWGPSKVGGQYQLVSGQHLNPNEYTLDKDQETQVPYFTGPSDFTNEEAKLTKWSLKKAKEAVCGDLLITVKGSGVGTTMYLKLNRVVIGRQLMAIRSKVSSTNFLYHKIDSFKKYYEALASGNMIPGLSRSDILGTTIHLPKLPEQQKIASFLTAVDTKIDQLTQKAELLQQYKKGVMQQLFSQKLRFKDDEGKDYPEWEEKRLGEVFKSLKGKGISKEEVVTDGERACILYGELYTKYNEQIKEVASRTNFQDAVLSNDNDLLIPSSTTTTGIDLANVTALSASGVALGGDIIILRASKEKVFNTFFAYYLSNFKKYEIASRAQGITIVHIYFSSISDMKIHVPSISEQTKIANFLSALDAKIELMQTQLENTHQFKKGLLQQMFV